jgi:hypothetical protein
MPDPEEESQETEFEAVKKELEQEAPVAVQAPAPEDPATPEPTAEKPAEPEAKPEPETPETPETPEGEGEPKEPAPPESKDDATVIAELRAEVAAKDRAAGQERAQREDLAARTAGINDREQRMEFARRTKAALTDPNKADELIAEINANAEANVPLDPQKEMEIRNSERVAFGGLFMDQMRARLGLVNLSPENQQAAYTAAQKASGKDQPYAQEVLAAEIEISTGTSAGRVTELEAENKDLKGQIAANGDAEAGARLRGGGGPETPSEGVAGQHFTRAQIAEMDDGEYSRNEAAILADEAARIKRAKAAVR